MDKTNSTKRAHNFVDLSGRTFGLWYVIEYHSTTKVGSKSRWLCRCQCGKEKAIQGCNLRSGSSRGCHRCKNKRHGMVGTPEYNAWAQMRYRCWNRRRPEYHNYGGRGIVVCKRWQESFEAFLEDMGPRPTAKHTLERVNNDLGYSKNNCKWATWAEQSRNTRRTRLVTFNGTTQCITDWAKQIGMNPKTLYNRLNGRWSVERALTTPVKYRKRKVR